MVLPACKRAFRSVETLNTCLYRLLQAASSQPRESAADKVNKLQLEKENAQLQQQLAEVAEELSASEHRIASLEMENETLNMMLAQAEAARSPDSRMVNGNTAGSSAGSQLAQAGGMGMGASRPSSSVQRPASVLSTHSMSSNLDLGASSRSTRMPTSSAAAIASAVGGDSSRPSSQGQAALASLPGDNFGMPSRPASSADMRPSSGRPASSGEDFMRPSSTAGGSRPATGSRPLTGSRPGTGATGR